VSRLAHIVRAFACGWIVGSLTDGTEQFMSVWIPLFVVLEATDYIARESRR
jgi:hypothetical protein